MKNKNNSCIQNGILYDFIYNGPIQCGSLGDQDYDDFDTESYKYLPIPIHNLIRESQNKILIKKGLNLKKRIEICKKLFSIYNECSEYEKECIQKIIEKL